MLRVIRQAQLTQHAQRLCGEGFIKLNDVHIGDTESGTFQHLTGGGNRA